MQAKKYETMTIWPDGCDTEERYFDADLSEEEVQGILKSSAPFIFGYEKITFKGLVDIEDALGSDFKEDEGEYHTFQEWQDIMAEKMEGVCPGGQGYDK